MTTTLLSSIAGSLLSLLFSYLPGLSDWYARLGVNPDDGGTRKRLLMLALLCLTALASFATLIWPIGQELVYLMLY